jgi:hypothetical protein
MPARKALASGVTVIQGVFVVVVGLLTFWVLAAAALALVALVIFGIYVAGFALVYFVGGEAALTDVHSFLEGLRNR